jgi:glycosyltransferase involved in cell wall biosynthesis
MTFCIVSTGWNCAKFVERTLASVEEQSDPDWRICIVVDKYKDDTAAIVAQWCLERSEDERWDCQLNADQRYAVRNQYDAIQRLDPADDDVIVWLDLDGDRFAHPDVLARLREVYADPELQLTYGSYRPEPDKGTCVPAMAFPPQVIANNTYRTHVLRSGCCFNHLRTMRGRIYRAIPLQYLHWNDGRWYDIGVDYITMVPALELAGRNHRFITETLLIYNNGNPHADYRLNPQRPNESSVLDAMMRPALQPLKVSRV